MVPCLIFQIRNYRPQYCLQYSADLLSAHTTRWPLRASPCHVSSELVSDWLPLGILLSDWSTGGIVISPEFPLVLVAVGSSTFVVFTCLYC